MQSPETPNPRPFLVTLLAAGVLIIAGWNLLRLAMTLTQWAFLSGYNELSLPYLALSGLIWFAAGLPISMGLWRCKPWALRAVKFFTPAYVLYFWVDRLFMRHSTYQANWFFPALLTVFWLLFTFFACYRARNSPAFRIP